jgi:hypothetical protein
MIYETISNDAFLSNQLIHQKIIIYMDGASYHTVKDMFSDIY